MKKINLFLCAILLVPLGLFAACSEKTESEDPGITENPENSEIADNSSEITENSQTDLADVDLTGAKYAIINVRDFGEITIELHPEYAPNTTARFVENVRSDFYTGKNFHRVIADFMIQGGSFDGKGAPDPTVQGVMTEVHPDARHYYGAFCLAANQFGEGSDSFYIVNNKDTNAFEEYYSQVEPMARAELDDILENEDEYRAEYGDDAVDAILAKINGILNVPDDVRARYAEVGGVPKLDGDYTVFGYTVDGFDVIDAISAVPVVANEVGEMSKPVDEIIIEWIVLTDTVG